MIELRDLILRLRRGEGIKSLHRTTGRHKTVLRRLKALADERKWTLEGYPVPTENEIQALWFAKTTPQAHEGDKAHPLDAIKDEIDGWVNEKYSFVAIHRLVVQRMPCSETTVRRYIQGRSKCLPKPVIPRIAHPGEVMEVDFGLLGLVWDDQERRNRKAWVFSGRLRFSRKAYRRIVFTQDQDTFFACHIAAFEWFGGVVAQVVPDNLKAAIVKASHEEPLVNRAYRALAEHYGFAINPCLPRTPRHKGGVESDMKYVQSSFWPLFREREKALGHEVPRFSEANRALEDWNLTISETRIIGKVGSTVPELFATEQPLLAALPVERWDPVDCAHCSVGPDWRIQYGKSFYSVPYKFIGTKVLVVGSRNIVRIFAGTAEVAVHSRAKKPWAVIAVPDHGPPNAKEYLTTSTKGLVMAACGIGPHVGMMAEAILADRAVDGIRPLRALVRLQERYSPQDIDSVCLRLTTAGIASYGSVKNELKYAQEKLQAKSFRFARGLGFFDPGATESVNEQEVVNG